MMKSRNAIGLTAAALAFLLSSQVALGTVVTKPVLFFGVEAKKSQSRTIPAHLKTASEDEVASEGNTGNRAYSTSAKAALPISPAPVALPRRKPAKRSIIKKTAPEQKEIRLASAVTRRTDPFTIPLPSMSSLSYTSMPTPPPIEYNIPHRPQEEPLWCWAAAAQQAIGWVNNGRAPAQCAIVALAHGIPVNECCVDREGICARTGEIPAIGALVRRFGGDARELISVPRTPDLVYNILKNGDTLLIRIRPEPHDEAAGIRHMIVVRGVEWIRLPNGELQATLLYNDPLGAGQRAVSFNEIVDFFEQALIVSRS